MLAVSQSFPSAVAPNAERAVAPALALLPWLLRFRWVVVGGLLVVVFAPGLHFLPVDWPLVSVAIAAAALSNAVLQFVWLRRVQSRALAPAVFENAAGGLLLLDSLLLTLVLSGSGGAANPFTLLYLVLIVLAALVLDTRWTSFLTFWTAACFAVLFLPGINDPHAQCATAGGSAQAYGAHLNSMWFAFAAGAVVLAWVVRKLSLTLSEQRAQIALLREKTLKAAHLAQLATLAGGAAHELRTPLGTIAIAAHELRRALQQGNAGSEADLELIEAEVERCQEILFSLGPRFSTRTTTPSYLLPQSLLARAVAELAGSARQRVRLLPAASESMGQVHVDEAELLQAIGCVLANGLDATRANAAAVEVSLVERPGGKHGWVGFCVQDAGVGMTQDVVQQVTTPFFTTKEPGQGMGLGLFLVSAFCLAAGGELEIRSELGRGSRVVIWLPKVPGVNEPRTALVLKEQPA